MRTYQSSLSPTKADGGRWASYTARILLPAEPRVVHELLEKPASWRSWLPGAFDEPHDDEDRIAAAGHGDRHAPTDQKDRIKVVSEFFSATLEVQKMQVEDGASPATGETKFLIEGRDLAMGPIYRFQIALSLAPRVDENSLPDTSGEESSVRTLAELTLRWKGTVPYFGILFKPLFASYFKEFARHSLESLHEFVAAAKEGAASTRTTNPSASPGEAPGSKLRRKRRGSTFRGHPWWAPATPLTVSQTRSLASLCFYGMVMGYMTSLAGISQHQIIESFHGDDAALGRMLFALGIGSLPGIFLLPLGDRLGRRKILIPALVITAIASGLSAFAPSLAIFTGLQALVRAPLFVALSLAWIYLVEEMPPRGRAYAISLFTMTGGLGGGIGLLSLPWVQRISPSGWRLLFGAGLLTLLALPALTRDIPESHRFASAWHGANPLYLLRKPHSGRMLILLGAALASAIYGSPAARFQGRYIQNALGYTPGLYVLFTVVTTLPAAPGMLLGGRIADTIGRKTVGILAATVGALSQALLYWLSGIPLWVSSAIGSFVGAMWIPAMGSFSTELFPTSLRANASSATSAAGMAGGAAGSWMAGYLIVQTGSYGGAISLLLPAALLSGFLVLLLFPETKGKELEDISPEIEPPVSGIGGGLFR